MTSKLKEDLKEIAVGSTAVLLNTIYVWIVGGIAICFLCCLLYFLYKIFIL